MEKISFVDTNPKCSFESVDVTVFNKVLLNPSSSIITQVPESLVRFTNAGKTMFAPESIKNCKAVYDLVCKAQTDLMPLAEKIASECTRPYNAVVYDKGDAATAKEICFNGWILERFIRKTVNNSNSADYLYWDYCLGADGNLYMVTWGFENRYGKVTYTGYNVHDVLFFTPLALTSTHQNAFVAVNGGFLGALDIIAPGEGKKYLRVEYSDEINDFNFPIEIEEVDDYAYKMLGMGLLERLSLLQDNAEDWWLPVEKIEASTPVNNSIEAENNASNSEASNTQQKKGIFSKLKGIFGL